MKSTRNHGRRLRARPVETEKPNLATPAIDQASAARGQPAGLTETDGKTHSHCGNQDSRYSAEDRCDHLAPAPAGGHIASLVEVIGGATAEPSPALLMLVAGGRDRDLARFRELAREPGRSTLEVRYRLTG